MSAILRLFLFHKPGKIIFFAFSNHMAWLRADLIYASLEANGISTESGINLSVFKTISAVLQV